MKIKELVNILSRYDSEMDVKLSGLVYAGIKKYDWDNDVVELDNALVKEDLEESDIITHDNYIELFFCKKY